MFPFFIPIQGRISLPFVGAVLDTDNIADVFRGGGEVLKEFASACGGDAMGGLRSLGRNAASSLVAWKAFFAQRMMNGLRATAPLDGLATTTRGVKVTLDVELDAAESGKAGPSADAPSAPNASQPDTRADEDETEGEEGK